MSDVYVVFARTGAPGSKGISAFIVPGDSPGLTTEPLRTMGMPGWQLGAPRFQDVEVPAANMLGAEGQGFKTAKMTFDRSRPTVASQAVGVGHGAVDLALDFSLRRHTFGQPLLGHEGLQFKLAGMEADVAAAARSPSRRRRSSTRARDPAAGDRAPDAQAGRRARSDLARGDAGRARGRERPERAVPRGAARLAPGEGGAAA